MEEVDKSLCPLTVLQSELDSTDDECRLRAMRSLSTIATVLGEEKTRDELLPLLQNRLNDVDVVQCSIAEELGKFIDLIGGPSYAKHLMAPLEKLAASKVAMVRDSAVASLRNMTLTLDKENLELIMLPAYQRLLDSASYTARTAACCLITAFYPDATEPVKAQLLDDYRELCHDDKLLVRCTAASKLSDFSLLVDLNCLKKDMVQVLAWLTEDAQDTVRFVSILGAVTIAKRLRENNCELGTLLLTTMRLCVHDMAWRVRYMLAEKFLDLQLAYGPEMTRAELMPIMSCLARDPNGKVRGTMACKLAQFCSNLDADVQEEQILNSVMPHIRFLSVDSNCDIQLATVATLLHLGEILGTSDCVQQLFPLIVQMFRAGNNEVCTQIISNMGAFITKIGLQHILDEIIPIVKSKAFSSMWRGRQSFVDLSLALALHLDQHLFIEHLLEPYKKVLNDSVYSVRELAAEKLKCLVVLYDVEWCHKYVLPLIFDLINCSNYLFRITGLQCIRSLSEKCAIEYNTETLLPLIVGLAGDKVPNVRFNIAKTLAKMLSRISFKSLKSEVKPLLELLNVDADDDVKDFAKDALNSLECLKLSDDPVVVNDETEEISKQNIFKIDDVKQCGGDSVNIEQIIKMIKTDEDEEPLEKVESQIFEQKQTD